MSTADDVIELAAYLGADDFEIEPPCPLCGSTKVLLWWRDRIPKVRVRLHAEGCPDYPAASIDDQVQELDELPARVELAHLERLYSASAVDGGAT